MDSSVTDIDMYDSNEGFGRVNLIKTLRLEGENSIYTHASHETIGPGGKANVSIVFQIGEPAVEVVGWGDGGGGGSRGGAGNGLGAYVGLEVVSFTLPAAAFLLGCLGYFFAYKTNQSHSGQKLMSTRLQLMQKMAVKLTTCLLHLSGQTIQPRPGAQIVS